MTWGGRRAMKARAYWAQRLPLPCRRCRRPVLASHRWHVGHVIDLALGGSPYDPANQWVEHARCNEGAGGRLAAALRASRRAADAAPVVVGASRERRIRGW